MDPRLISLTMASDHRHSPDMEVVHPDVSYGSRERPQQAVVPAAVKPANPVKDYSDSEIFLA